MPFQYIDNVRYSIDYIKLFEHLNTHRFIRNTSIQRTFLEHWIAALWEVDNLTEFDLATEHSVYQHPIFYGDVEFYLHFDITNISNIEKETKNIPLTDFTDKESDILLDTTNSAIKNSLNNKIIICEFPRSDTQYLVLSGHELIQQSITNNVDTVNVLFIDKSELLLNNCFSSPFDKYYYQFTLELNQVFQKYGKLKFNELHLLKKSFLNQTDHKFY